jgi:Zn-finger nucleic acid-binding protein
MLLGSIGGLQLHECSKCLGMWLAVAAFEKICRDAEKRAAILGSPSLGPPRALVADPVRYRRCPVCQEFMNRTNFAGRSGVVLDTCRAHGTWFDADELHRIVKFIHAGGLEAAREQARRRTRTPASSLGPFSGSTATSHGENWKLSLLGEVLEAVAGGLFDLFP